MALVGLGEPGRGGYARAAGRSLPQKPGARTGRQKASRLLARDASETGSLLEHRPGHGRLQALRTIRDRRVDPPALDRAGARTLPAFVVAMATNLGATYACGLKPGA